MAAAVAGIVTVAARRRIDRTLLSQVRKNMLTGFVQLKGIGGNDLIYMEGPIQVREKNAAPRRLPFQRVSQRVCLNLKQDQILYAL